MFRELWRKEKEEERSRDVRKKEEEAPTVAELTTPAKELRRLRTVVSLGQEVYGREGRDHGGDREWDS